MNEARAFGSILVALDDSPRAPLVFTTAAALARCADARVTLIRVLTEPTDIPPAARTSPDHLAADLEGIVRDEFRRLMDSAPDLHFAPPIVVEGDPWRRILDVARQLDVDLIVVGNHRHHGFERVLGTVASRVINHADRNVLVVHQRESV
ncbi:MAG TPA: universal stress protein [Polyangia bacterium]|nr:universal stress protein [Polyangia bacterium]